MAKATATENNGEGGNRFKVAIRVLNGAIGCLLVFAMAALVGAGLAGKEAFTETSRYLLTAVLPLIGTWVGTVLTFYFSQDNFESASKSVRATMRDMQDEKLRAVLVKDQMMTRAAIVTLRWDPQTDKDKLLDTDVLDVLRRHSVARLVLTTTSDVVRGVLHESLIYRFHSEVLSNPTNNLPDKITFADLWAYKFAEGGPTIGDIARQTTAFVTVDGTLADAKGAMEARTRAGKVTCRDVIVTQTGAETDPILGWLTDRDIEKFTRAE